MTFSCLFLWYSGDGKADLKGGGNILPAQRTHLQVIFLFGHFQVFPGVFILPVVLVCKP